MDFSNLPDNAFALLIGGERSLPHHSLDVTGKNENRSIDIQLLRQSIENIPSLQCSKHQKKMAFNHLTSHAKTILGRKDVAKFSEADLDDLQVALDTLSGYDDWADIDSSVKEESKTVFVGPEKIFKAGTWNGKEYTDQEVRDLVTNFHELRGSFLPPLKCSHYQLEMKNDEEAIGYVSDLKYEDGFAVATFEYERCFYNWAITQKRYRFKSSEIYHNYGQDGKKYTVALKAVALLGISTPAVFDLGELKIEAFDSTGSGLNTCVFDTETETIVEFGENKMTDAEKKDSPAVETPVSAEAPVEPKLDNKSETTASANEVKSTTVEQFEAMKTQIASEMKAQFDAQIASYAAKLNEANELIVKLHAEQQTAEINTFVDSMVKNGNLLPKQKTLVAAIFDAIQNKKNVVMFSADDSQAAEVDSVELFKNFLSDLKQWEKRELSQESTVAGGVTRSTIKTEDAKFEIIDAKEYPVINAGLVGRTNQIISEHKAKGTEISYRDALKMAQRESK